MAVSDSRLLCPSAPVRAWSHLYGMLNVRAGQLQCNQNRGLNPSTETERVRKRLERSKVYAFNDHMPRPPICFFTTHGYSCSPTSPAPTQMFAPAVTPRSEDFLAITATPRPPKLECSSLHTMPVTGLGRPRVAICYLTVTDLG